MRRRPSIETLLGLTARHFVASVPENNVQKPYFVCNHTVKREKKGAIQDFIAQVVMFHCVVPTVSESIILRKLSDIQI